MKTLAEDWTTFSRKILDPIHASVVQRTEMRRAFYAGAASMFELFMQVTPDHVSEDQGVDLLNRLTAELEQFGKDLQVGRA